MSIAERFNARVPKELAEAARAFEVETGMSLSDQIRTGLEHYLDGWLRARSRRARRSPAYDTSRAAVRRSSFQFSER